MKGLGFEMEKSEAFIYLVYEEGSICIMEYISAQVTHDISAFYYFGSYFIKILSWNMNAFEIIVSHLKSEEVKLLTIDLIIKNKIKKYVVKLLIGNQLLFFSFLNW